MLRMIGVRGFVLAVPVIATRSGRRAQAAIVCLPRLCDVITIEINRDTLEGSVNFVGTAGRDLSPAEADHLLAQRTLHPDLLPHASLPDDTRLWAALQQASGGVWQGCVYDTDRIIAAIQAGLAAMEEVQTQSNPGGSTPS